MDDGKNMAARNGGILKSLLKIVARQFLDDKHGSKGLLTHRRKRPNVFMRILTNRTKARFVIVRKCTF